MNLSALRGTGIKSIQRGSTTAVQGGTNVSVTISPVNMSKSMVLSSYRYYNNANGVSGHGTAVLDSSTNLSVSAGGNVAGANVTINWQVVEFK
jgi:hypothetical protein